MEHHATELVRQIGKPDVVLRLHDGQDAATISSGCNGADGLEDGEADRLVAILELLLHETVRTRREPVRVVLGVLAKDAMRGHDAAVLVRQPLEELRDRK